MRPQATPIISRVPPGDSFQRTPSAPPTGPSLPPQPPRRAPGAGTISGPATGLGQVTGPTLGGGAVLDGPTRFSNNMPVYHTGTDYVPKTGPAILKKGEAVLNNKDADKLRKGKRMSKSDVYNSTSKSLGGKSKAPAKVVHKVEIRKGTSGGHIIEHHHTHPDHHPMEEHTTANDAAMLSHLQNVMGNSPASGADPNAMPPDPSAGAGAPSPGAAPAAAPAAGAPAAGPVAGM